MTFVYVDPINISPMNQFRTMYRNDPLIPPGYVLSGGSDGAYDRDVKAFTPGQASGGYPTYPAIGGEQTRSPNLAALTANLRNLNGTSNTATSTIPDVAPSGALIWGVGAWGINTWD